MSTKHSLEEPYVYLDVSIIDCSSMVYTLTHEYVKGLAALIKHLVPYN